MLGVMPFIKLQTTLKQHLSGKKDEKWDEKLNTFVNDLVHEWVTD